MARGKSTPQTAQTPVYSFAIVKFHHVEEAQFDVAPLKWIQKTGNKTTIYWPGEDDAATPKSLVNLIMKEAVVDKETWMLYNITVVAKFDTYVGAQQKLGNAIAGEVVVSTDLDNRGRGGRNKAKKRNAEAASVFTPTTSKRRVCSVSSKSDAEDSESSSHLGSAELAPSSSSEDDIPKVTRNKQVPPIYSQGKVVTAKQLQLPTVPPGLGKKRANSEISSCRPPKTKSTPPKAKGSLENSESRITTVATDVAPLICAKRSIAPGPDYGPIRPLAMDGLENDRISNANKSSCSMEVGVYRQRSTTVRTTEASQISTFIPDSKKIDFLIDQNKRILRGQEQIKAQNLDIKNTLAVVMNNTIPPDPELEGVKEEFRIPVTDLKFFDTLNVVLKQDKIKRLKLRSYLIGVGGSHNRVVGNVLKKLMRFSVGAQFCLRGQNANKRRFDDTELMNLVIESVRATRGVRLSETDIKSKIGRWLKSAPKKVGKDDSEAQSDDSGETN